MGSIADRVFRVPELLEQVLSSLPQKDLLLSQRVNTAFRDTVQASLKLQRTLCFVPDWRLETRSFDAYAKHNRPGRRPENNRLLLRAFPGSYPTITLVVTENPAKRKKRDDDDDDDDDDNSDGGHDSGYDSASSTEDINYGRRNSEQWSWDCCISFPADALPGCDPAVLYPEASWRRMYLSQPPCESFYLVRRWQRSKRPALVRDGGITMGEFVDAASQAQPAWHPSYVSSDRDWHFEGNIKCSGIEQNFSGQDSQQLASEFAYVYHRRDGHNVVRTFSDEWHVGR